jgi:hypothetical protein
MTGIHPNLTIAKQAKSIRSQYALADTEYRQHLLYISPTSSSDKILHYPGTPTHTGNRHMS